MATLHTIRNVIISLPGFFFCRPCSFEHRLSPSKMKVVCKMTCTIEAVLTTIDSGFLAAIPAIMLKKLKMKKHGNAIKSKKSSNVCFIADGFRFNLEVSLKAKMVTMAVIQYNDNSETLLMMRAVAVYSSAAMVTKKMMMLMTVQTRTRMPGKRPRLVERQSTWIMLEVPLLLWVEGECSSLAM